MKKSPRTWLPVLVLSLGQSLSLAETGVVTDQAPDNTGGKIGGGAVGFLLGGLGGPLGSLAGGLAGIFIGGAAQEAAGLSGVRYRVEDGEGGGKWLRSPRHRFATGDRASIEGATLAPVVRPAP